MPPVYRDIVRTPDESFVGNEKRIQNQIICSEDLHDSFDGIDFSERNILRSICGRLNMASVALQDWQNNRTRRLSEIDAQSDTTFGLTPVPDLADENLRGYVMLLSAHFQGFCRDLHSECIQVFSNAAPAHLQSVIQRQCRAGRDLDGANPKMESIRKDFERFDLDLSVALGSNPANALLITHLGHMILWRNYVAHHKGIPPGHGGPLSLTSVRLWKTSCDGLAAELDGIMYNQLRRVLGRPPW
jgi:hypothetical protein